MVPPGIKIYDYVDILRQSGPTWMEPGGAGEDSGVGEVVVSQVALSHAMQQYFHNEVGKEEEQKSPRSFVTYI